MLSLFKKKTTTTTLQAFINGTLCPIVDVPDDIFSKKLMGDGVAIIANDKMLYAPCDGKITLLAPTKHAIALQLKDDVQVLIHIGLDSALHKDDVFTVLVKLGDRVRCGDPLIEISDTYVKASNPLYIPLVIVENPQEKVFHFIDAKELVTGKDSTIAHYE